MIVLAFISADDAWVMTAGALCNVACALLGTFLVLRRMSLLGDAISHAILPGLAIAFLLTQSRNIAPMMAGALAVGLLTTFLTQALSHWGRVPEDASMGVVFSSLFALGVLLITYTAKNVDLDPGCVLYGDIGATPSYPLVVWGREWPIPRQVAILGAVCLINVAAILTFYKELQVVSFDPLLATIVGISPTVVHYGLMTLVAGTSVAAFESVGSILVVAMLIAPAATAHLLTDRLPVMLGMAALLGAAASVIGYLVSAFVVDTPPAAMMASVAGLFFFLAVLFAPRYGFVSRRIRQWSLTLRIVREDMLGMLYRCGETGRNALFRSQLLAAAGGGAAARCALRSLSRRGLVAFSPQGETTLTDRGRVDASSLVRSHRLWESYLKKHLGLPEDHLHSPAERMEHFVSKDLQTRIASDIADSADPHGKQIPPGAAS